MNSAQVEEFNIDSHSLQYRVASLAILSAYDDARALGMNQHRHFTKAATPFGIAKALSREFRQLKEFVDGPEFEGMVRTLGRCPVEARATIYNAYKGGASGRKARTKSY